MSNTGSRAVRVFRRARAASIHTAVVLAIASPGAVLAQSTGTIEAEEEIIVQAKRQKEGIQGVVAPDSPKARTVLTQEAIERQSAGQSILNTINVVPSVNFTNNDPYGSSGGNIRIRGFDGNRVSLTFDGLPLNDTGNYAIFSNQQLDPELIEQVNVNQGTTDVDSPTASAAGGTVNYRTVLPSRDFSGMTQLSLGQFKYRRLFGMLHTGEMNDSGTRAFIAASTSQNDKFRGPGEINKKQFNARLYQPIGDDGNFVSISAHYNRNRNNFYRNLNLGQATADLAANGGEYRFDNNPECFRPAPNAATPQNEASTLQPSTAIRGTTSATNPLGLDTSCTNYFGLRINPSNTGNLRINSRFKLSDTLTLTVDPSFQYVLANGGGFSTVAENAASVRGASLTAIDSGVDFNGDGNVGNFGSIVGGVFVPAAPNALRTNFVPDTIALYTPNNTNTHRYGVIASLRWDFADDQSLRVAYTYDRGRHRQTGEWGFLDPSGNPENPFGGRNGRPVLAADGTPLRQRDRLSIALLNQISVEYRGRFLDDRLSATLGVRAPFFKRELNQFCFTQASNGNAVCTSQPVGTTPTTGAGQFFVIPPTTTFTGSVPAGAVYAPFSRDYKYDKVLPNVGFTYDLVDNWSLFGSYAQGFSAPRTDNLYRAPFVGVEPETTNNFDLGVRYSTSRYQVQVNGYFNRFKNRIVTSFDQLQGISVDRNVGSVEIRGVEASVDMQPVQWFYARLFASYIDSELKDNIQLGSTAGGLPIVAVTAGKQLAETPELQYGARLLGNYGPVSFGASIKSVGERFATDLNDLEVSGYTTIDLDARLDLEVFGLKNSFFQLNVINVTDRQYLGSINTQIALPTLTQAGAVQNVALGATIPGGANPTFAVGAPRTIMGSIRFSF